MAKQYAPCVLFCEDIDQVTAGDDRSEALNEILNTLDGVDTKSAPIITVLTTNHIERINPGFLRAGRIDTVIEMKAPDAKAAAKFVQLYGVDAQGVSLLHSDINLESCGTALEGLVPAFISEVVQKAKSSAIYRHGVNIVGQITTDDVCVAARSLKSHIQMVNRKTEISHAEKVTQAVALVNSVKP